MDPPGLEDLVPAWVLCLRAVAWPALAFAVVWGTGALALAWQLRIVGGLDPSLHWSERARRAASLHRIPWLGLLCGVQVGYWAWACLRASGAVGSRGPALAALLAAGVAFALLGHRVKRTLGISRGLGAHVRGVLFQACVKGLPVLAMAFALGSRLRGEPWTSPPFLVALGALVLGCAGGGIALARLLGLARPACERTRQLAAAQGASVGVVTRAVLEVDMDQANAFALPMVGVVAVTRRAQALLTEDELTGVLAHEVAHLAEGLGRRLVLLLPCLLGLGFLPFVRGVGWPTVAGLGVAAVLLVLGIPVLLRGMERRADHHAGSGNAAFGVALERMHEHNLAPATGTRPATHPDLYERLLAAGRTPDFPRPAPPSRAARASGLPILIGASALGFALWLGMQRILAAEGRAPVLVSLAVLGPSARDLGRLGRLAWELDPGRAADCYRAAAELQPDDPWWPLSEALAAVNSGRCDEARGALERAEGLVAGALAAGAAPSAERAELHARARGAVEGCAAR
jgi:Zn-dependent protease with chaperone function